MKISDLAPMLLTRMEVLDANNLPTGVYFTGHTPISKEFEDANRRYFPQPKSQDYYLGKNGNNHIKVPNDPTANDKRKKAIAQITTNVEGLEDFDIAKDDVYELFCHPQMAKAFAQWVEHLDDEGKHTAPPAPSAKPTSKSSGG